MSNTRIKRATRLLGLVVLFGLSLQPFSIAKGSEGPDLPEACQSLQILDGSKLAFHVYARGVQIYKWNGATWDFVAPMASLFAETNYFGDVGMHYGGPTWESKSGSKVKAARVPGTGCTPDPSAVAWLLLQSTSTSGSGIFNSVTYIQRVNTKGGVAPSDAGSTIGEVREVPYNAEYYFYRAQN
jgi:hypothetical protein